VRVASRRPALPAGLIVVLFVLSAACAEAPPESSVVTPADSIGESETDVVLARYLTHFAFAGTGGHAFFGSFSQETDARALVRDYEAWLAGPTGWTGLLRVRDTLPVPRAAWRIVPAGPMTVRVGDAREVVTLSFAAGDGRVSLEAGDEVAVWTGPTGQRESVGVAGLALPDTTDTGILFFRRAARALQFPGDSATTRAFVLADDDGNGLLIEAEEDGSAVARTYLHGSVEAWDGIVFAPDTTVATALVRRWSFEIPAALLTGTIRAIASPAAETVPVFRVECELVADGDVFRFVGLSAPLPLP